VGVGKAGERVGAVEGCDVGVSLTVLTVEPEERRAGDVVGASEGVGVEEEVEVGQFDRDHRGGVGDALLVESGEGASEV